VTNSSGTAAEKAGLSGARVTITDNNCATAAKRIYTTNSAGNPPLDPLGLPWGTYSVCASATIGGKARRIKNNSVAVQSLEGTSLPLALSSTLGGGVEEATCP
jgi:hypothetical protein